MSYEEAAFKQIEEDMKILDTKESSLYPAYAAAQWGPGNENYLKMEHEKRLLNDKISNAEGENKILRSNLKFAMEQRKRERREVLFKLYQLSSEHRIDCPPAEARYYNEPGEIRYHNHQCPISYIRNIGDKELMHRLDIDKQRDEFEKLLHKKCTPDNFLEISFGKRVELKHIDTAFDVLSDATQNSTFLKVLRNSESVPYLAWREDGDKDNSLVKNTLFEIAALIEDFYYPSGEKIKGFGFKDQRKYTQEMFVQEKREHYNYYPYRVCHGDSGGYSPSALSKLVLFPTYGAVIENAEMLQFIIQQAVHNVEQCEQRYSQGRNDESNSGTSDSDG